MPDEGVALCIFLLLPFTIFHVDGISSVCVTVGVDSR